MTEGMPEQIGPYTITREIGRGGMGVVCLAREVAIKPRLRRQSPTPN